MFNFSPSAAQDRISASVRGPGVSPILHTFLCSRRPGVVRSCRAFGPATGQRAGALMPASRAYAVYVGVRQVSIFT